MDFFRKNSLFMVIFIAAVLNLVIFYFTFGFHPNNDTDTFISTIEFFKGESQVFVPNRYMVPFYPIVAAKLLFFLSPAQSIIIINIVFYFGLLFLTYALVARVFKSKWIGFVTALLVATNYAMIRYGLTQVQDIGGYFWCVLTIYAIWRWREQKQNGWLLLSSLGVAFGMLTKESGAMGALFAGIIILVENNNIKKTIQYLVMFAFFPLITMVINSLRGLEIGFSSLTYIIDTWKYWGPGNYKFIRWFGVNVSTYNLVWIPVVCGLGLLYKNRRSVDRDIVIYLLAILPTSFSYFSWPVFIARTVFISAWLFLPIAAYALYELFKKGKFWKYFSIFVITILVVIPYILQNTLRYAHVFTIFDECHNNIACSWHYFWQNRDGFSKIK